MRHRIAMGVMPMHNNVFLQMVSGHPYRFFICASLLMLNIVSGVSTNLMLCGGAESERLLAVLSLSGAPEAAWALAGSTVWNVLLTAAVFYGRGGGWRSFAAYAACACEGFLYGFSLSALLFVYGAPRVLPALLFAAVCGMAGMVLRLYCFVYEPPAAQRNTRAPLRFWLQSYAPVWQGLLVNIFLQAVLLPYCLVRI